MPSLSRATALGARGSASQAEQWQTSALIAAGALGSLVVGALVATDRLLYAVVLAGALGAALVLIRAGLAVTITLLVILTADGIPGLNTAHLQVAGAFNPATACAMLLFAIGAARFASGRSHAVGRAGTWLFLWGLAFLAVWFIGWARAVNDGVPMFKALTFGQTFLVFGLLLPVAPWLLRSQQELRRFLTVFIGLGLVYAVGEIAAALGVISPSVINVSLTANQGGVTRVYAPMSDAVFLILACSIGVALATRGKRARLALAVAVVTGVAVAVELTRAQYFALVGGLVAALLLIGLGGSAPIKARIGWRVISTVAVGVAIVGVLALTVPQVGQSSAAREVASRATSGIAQLTGQAPAGATNTFAYRQSIDRSMLTILGSKWPIGLGFLAPPTFYFAQLPSGSIMNTDVGVMNVLMPLGAVGTVLLYLPLACLLAWAVSGLRKNDGMTGERFGVTIWTIAVLAASVTLVTLFTTGGLVIVALAIGICIHRWKSSPTLRHLPE